MQPDLFCIDRENFVYYTHILYTVLAYLAQHTDKCNYGTNVISFIQVRLLHLYGSLPTEFFPARLKCTPPVGGHNVQFCVEAASILIEGLRINVVIFIKQFKYYSATIWIFKFVKRKSCMAKGHIRFSKWLYNQYCTRRIVSLILGTHIQVCSVKHLKKSMMCTTELGVVDPSVHMINTPPKKIPLMLDHVLGIWTLLLVHAIQCSFLLLLCAHIDHFVNS